MISRLALASSVPVFLLMFVTSSQAQVSARLTVDGECPSAPTLERSLRGVASVDPEGQWGVAVSADETTTVTLVAPEGTLALSRHLEGGSCSDRADAIAVILHAHLLDLSLVAPDALTREIDDVPEEPVSEDRPEDPSAAHEPAGRPPEPPEPPPEEQEPQRTGGHRVDLGLAAAAGLGVDPLLLFGSVRAELGWKPDGFPLAPRLEIGGRLFEDQRGQEDALTLRGLTFAVVVSLPLKFRNLWFAPLAGAGLAVDFAEFSGLSAVEARMLLTAGFELGWMLARPLWLRLDARVDALPWADSYLVEPVGQVGRSPHSVISLGIAFGLRFDDS